MRWNSSKTPWNLTEGPGLYALYEDDRLRYIGQSRNLYKRVGQHFRRKKWITKIKWREERSEGEALMTEFRLIRRLRPEMNVSFTRGD